MIADYLFILNAIYFFTLNDFPGMEATLEKFIKLQTVAGNQQQNEEAIKFINQILIPAGFDVVVEGESPHFQPVLVARYSNPGTKSKVVLYGHYDVERIKSWEKWNAPPFELTRLDGRYFCRGIADNKGILLTRMLAITEMIQEGVSLPNILWIIQGEEEVGGDTPFKVIPKHFEEFNAKVYVEETGVNKDGSPVLFYLPQSSTIPKLVQKLNSDVFNGLAILENRSLRKFSACPFLTNIPHGGLYIGFGPNDPQCRIHADNESLDIGLLADHKKVFKKFISWAYQNLE